MAVIPKKWRATRVASIRTGVRTWTPIHAKRQTKSKSKEQSRCPKIGIAISIWAKFHKVPSEIARIKTGCDRVFRIWTFKEVGLMKWLSRVIGGLKMIQKTTFWLQVERNTKSTNRLISQACKIWVKPTVETQGLMEGQLWDSEKRACRRKMSWLDL